MCFAILGFSLVNNSKNQARRFAEAEKERIAEAAKKEAEGKTENPATPGGGDPVAKPPGEKTTAAPVEPVEKSQEFEISTEQLKLHLTNRGAGIKIAELADHLRKLESDGDFVTINESRDSPIGALSPGPNEVDDSLWTVKERTSTSVTFVTDTPGKLHLEKTFRIPDHGRPYEVEMQLSIRNDTGAPLELGSTDLKYVYVGGQAPLHFNEWSMQIGLFLREDGSTFRTKTVDYFGGKKKILGIFGRSEKPYAIFPSESKVADNLAWAGVNNQFYATLIHAREPADGQVWADKYPVVIDGDEEKSKTRQMRGCELAMGLPQMAMNPGDQKTLTYDIFMGPKESGILKAGGGGRGEDHELLSDPDFWTHIRMGHQAGGGRVALGNGQAE